MMRKAVSDALVVFEIETLKIRAWWPAYILVAIVIPIGMLYFAKWLVPPGAEDQVGTRLMTGSLVFAIGLTTVNNLSQVMLTERFNSTLKLIVTSPVHPLSYAAGAVGFSMALGVVTAVAVLSFSPVVGIDVHLHWWLAPVLVLTSLSLTGMGLIIATWSPALEIGNLFANLFGILVTLLSPVYFPIERLPEWMQWVARASPYTYAAASVDTILSGDGTFSADIVYLALLTAAGLAAGTLGLRWRES